MRASHCSPFPILSVAQFPLPTSPFPIPAVEQGLGMTSGYRLFVFVPVFVPVLVGGTGVDGAGEGLGN
jgi:hypothetical protein